MIIHNFPIGFGEPWCVILPVDAKVVEFNRKQGVATMWVELVPDRYPQKKRLFQIFGTGHDIPDHAVYIGTIHDNDQFVWHLYEVTE